MTLAYHSNVSIQRELGQFDDADRSGEKLCVGRILLFKHAKLTMDSTVDSTKHEKMEHCSLPTAVVYLQLMDTTFFQIILQ